MQVTTETLPRCICCATAEAELALRLFLALKAKVPTPGVLIPSPPPQLQKGRAEASRTPALGDTIDRTEQEEKKPTPGDKEELARWSGAGTGSQSPRPAPCWISPSSFLCVLGGRAAITAGAG